MTETREQYREHLRQVTEDAEDRYQATVPKPSLLSAVNDYSEWVWKMGRVSAEAVASQVLRDVRAELRGYTNQLFEPAQKRVDRFATERGIDLTESEDTP